MGLLLPLDARSRGRRRFFLPLFSPIPLSKRRRLPFKKTPTQPTLSSHVPPLFLPIKTGEEKKKDDKKERRQKREGREDKKKGEDKIEKMKRRRPEEEERREKQGERKKKKTE
jgi:hypothetical protein